MNQLKPHLVKSVFGSWICTGDNFRVMGATPTKAYAGWIRAFRDMVNPPLAYKIALFALANGIWKPLNYLEELVTP